MDLRQPPLSTRPSVKSLRGKVVRVQKKTVKRVLVKQPGKSAKVQKMLAVMVLKLER